MNRTAWILVLGGVACDGAAPTLAPPPEDTPDLARTLDEVIADPPAFGASVVIGPLRITSPPSARSGHVYAQDPVSGRGIELRRGALDPWPPAVGRDVTLALAWAGSPEVPVAWIASSDQVLEDQPGGPPTVGTTAEAWAAFALLRVDGLEVTSPTDPLGRADTSAGFVLSDWFGAGLPGLTSVGVMTALVLDDGALALRDRGDWVGTWEDPAPLPVDVATVRSGALRPGTLVSLRATQATPWSVGDRFVVVQDEAGLGLWVDAEGFGPGVGAPGEVGTWVGEVRDDRGVAWLRCWTAPVVDGVADVVETAPGEGAITTFVVADVGAPGLLGERTTGDGVVLDDRFLPIDSLVAPALVRGAWLVRDGEEQVAVLSWAAAAP